MQCWWVEQKEYLVGRKEVWIWILLPTRNMILYNSTQPFWKLIFRMRSLDVFQGFRWFRLSLVKEQPVNSYVRLLINIRRQSVGRWSEWLQIPSQFLSACCKAGSVRTDCWGERVPPPCPSLLTVTNPCPLLSSGHVMFSLFWKTFIVFIFWTFAHFICACMCHDMHVGNRGHLLWVTPLLFHVESGPWSGPSSGLMTRPLIHRAVSMALLICLLTGNHTRGVTRARGVLSFWASSPYPLLFVSEVCGRCAAQCPYLTVLLADLLPLCVGIMHVPPSPASFILTIAA